MKAFCTEAGAEWMDYIQHHKSSFHFSHAASNSNNKVLGEATSSLVFTNNSAEVSRPVCF